jgi:formate dehydrogenase subunit delta
MSSKKLVSMANQIAGFFRSYPEEQAIVGIHDHIAAFWTPRMRDAIMNCARERGSKLDPLVLRALQTFRVAEGPVEEPATSLEDSSPSEGDAG